MTWMAVWRRAVIEPAWRRALAVWLGTGIVCGVVFGPTGMHPVDLTRLALASPGVAAVLGATWLLLFVPTARVIVRADAARYLRSLPSPWLAPKLAAAGALIALQLPWLALWVAGDGARGLAIVVGWTLPILAIAAWHPRERRTQAPRWTAAGQALRAIYLRALRRRAGDALVRGAGLAMLAGLAGGLLVRNNGLVGGAAGVMGAAVISVVVIPGHAGVHGVLLEAHRQTTWLAGSLGITRATRIVALVHAIVLVHMASSAIAVTVATLIVGPGSTALAIAAITSGASLCAALAEARVVLAAEHAPSSAARIATGTTVVAAIVVLWLGILGVPGLGAIAATCMFAILTVPR